MKVVRSRAELDAARASLPAPVALVPTMGALHAGHAALLDAARAAARSVVVSIFVNPLQFGANEDLGRYPRSLDADLALCERHGADLVWTPGVDDVYPGESIGVQVDPGPLGGELEGMSRPGHFAGVLTVVAKLFHLIAPQLAFFGAKDYQQFCLIEAMVAELDFAVALTAVPTVREPDGLALSSRNAYLDADERGRAVSLSRALRAGQAAAPGGWYAVRDAALAELRDVEVDYIDLRSPDLIVRPAHGPARLLVAARVGRTRLIDNADVVLP